MLIMSNLQHVEPIRFNRNTMYVVRHGSNIIDTIMVGQGPPYRYILNPAGVSIFLTITRFLLEIHFKSQSNTSKIEGT